MVDVGSGAAPAGVLRADVDRIRWNAAAAQQCVEAAAGVRGVGRLDESVPAYGQDAGQFCQLRAGLREVVEDTDQEGEVDAAIGKGQPGGVGELALKGPPRENLLGQGELLGAGVD
jgi:hypothetical protein